MSVGPAATKSLHIMIIDDALTGEVPQPGLPIELGTGDPLVKKALALMQQSMDAPLTVERLAERLGVGRRKLERHFREALGLTPAAADRTIRDRAGAVPAGERRTLDHPDRQRDRLLRRLAPD